MGRVYFNPGCALSIYKPDFEKRILSFLNENYEDTIMHNICCKHEPMLEEGSLIINVCAGCDRRFSSLYNEISTISLWEVLDSISGFKYPDHKGLTLSIHDPCPIREKPQVHKAVRSILKKMNVISMETEYHSTHSKCCGDSFYPSLPVYKANELMKERAKSMPCQQVCVYCISCIKSMHIGGRTPRYLLDLIFHEPTIIGIYDTIKWHKQVKKYEDSH